MMESLLDLTTTRFVFPSDCKLLPVDELSPRLRTKIGPVDGSQLVITRPGFRMNTKLISATFAALLGEFRTASLITEAIKRFCSSYDQNPTEILDLSFDALVASINGRTLVSEDSVEAQRPKPSLAAGQAIGDMEVEHLVRSLDDTEVYRVRMKGGKPAALKIARDKRTETVLSHEVKVLEHLSGEDSPALLEHGTFADRRWLAIEWCSGVSISVVAQQARASGDRDTLQRLIVRLLEAYDRMHKRGVVHGDIHTGNILVDKSEKVIILDFGRARLIADRATKDPNRAGIAHYYDPQMAAAILNETIAPAASLKSEQYALASLAYLLLTGLHPIDPAAEQTELLRRIVERPMLPFAMRGIKAWPGIEMVLRRALAKKEKDRFPQTSAFSRALRNVKIVRRGTTRSSKEVEKIVKMLKDGASKEITTIKPHVFSWLALRGALALGDPELLAIADLWSEKSENGLEEYCVAASVAHARSDHKKEYSKLAAFIDKIDRMTDYFEKCQVLIQAAHIFQDRNTQEKNVHNLVEWFTASYREFNDRAKGEEALLHVGLILEKAGVMILPADFRERIHALKRGSFWFWGLSYEVLQKQEYLEQALSVKLSGDTLSLGLAYLRLHQLTGQMRWVYKARQLVPHLNKEAISVENSLLLLELEMPSRMVKPPFSIGPNFSTTL